MQLKNRKYQLRSWRWIGQLLLVCAIIFVPITPIYAQSTPLQVHPALITLAEKNPNELVRIIVQQKPQERISSRALAQTGGQITRDLPIVNGMAMELPARAVMQLARARGVRWITIDAPVIPASDPGTSCNLLKNPGFELGDDEWTDWNNTLELSVSGQSHTGAFAMQLGGQNSGGIAQTVMNATAGTTYRISGAHRLIGSGWATIGVDFQNSNGQEIGETYISFPTSNTYKFATTSAVAPAGTTQMSVWIYKTDGQTLYIDDLSLEATSGSCGSASSANGATLFNNSDFEEGISGWDSSNSSMQVSTNAYRGSKAIFLGSASGSIAQAVNQATPGTLYTARGMFHRTPGTAWSGMGIDFFDANWNEISDVYLSIPETTGYAPLVISGIAPPGTARASIWIYKNSGGSLLIDDVTLSAGDAPDAYVQSTGAQQLWYESQGALDGSGVTVAVIDSGIASHADLNNSSGTSRVVAAADLTSSTEQNKDQYGHGSHVAGIIAGNGSASNGVHRGIAPNANLISMRISDGKGMTYASDLIEGLQWIYDNRITKNIRVANISLNSTVPESYHLSPINAAVELLWFNGITVVVSAGNNGNGTEGVPLFAPANDPFVITVGAVDDQGSGSLQDDTVATFSAWGTTEDGYAKPDLVASGRNLISLSAGTSAAVVKDHPSHRVGSYYFRMSGTSMAAPVVSGVVALLLENDPNLTPDQIKHRLKETAANQWPGYSAAKAGAGHVNAYAAIHGTSTASANTGIAMSNMLSGGDETIAWDSVSWNSVSWNSVSWNSVSWNSVSWNSVSWNSVTWSSIWDDLTISNYSNDKPPARIDAVIPNGVDQEAILMDSVENVATEDIVDETVATNGEQVTANKVFIPLVTK